MNQQRRKDRGTERQRDRAPLSLYITLSLCLSVPLSFCPGAAGADYARGAAQSRQKEATAQPTPRPVVFTTAPKLTVAKLRTGETETYDVRGKLSFTVTAANSDDTVAGAINYTMPDDARQKIAALIGKPLGGVPSSITYSGVIAA